MRWRSRIWRGHGDEYLSSVGMARGASLRTTLRLEAARGVGCRFRRILGAAGRIGLLDRTTRGGYLMTDQEIICTWMQGYDPRLPGSPHKSVDDLTWWGARCRAGYWEYCCRL